tara:strand:+ start:2714 stop:3937 length:1224 start_codon:yes stop_codon:yes gene_type:complete
MEDYRITMLKKSVFMLAHGTTPTEEMPEKGYRFMFRCPENIRIVSFEYPGHTFNRYDAGYMYNYIHQRINIDGSDIGLLNESRVTIPIGKIKIPAEDDSRSYYCRVYNPGEEVPNICFKFEDNHTQTGIYDMYDGRNNTVPYAAFLPKTEESGNVIYKFQLNTNLLNIDIVNKALGGVNLQNNDIGNSHPIYNKPDTNLEKVVNDVNYIKREPTTLYIVSCRVFTSRYMENMNRDFQIASSITSETGENYNILFTGFKDIYNKLCETIPHECNTDYHKKWAVELAKLKVTLDEDLGKLIVGLTTMVNNSNVAYGNLKELLNNYLFKDYTNNKKEVVLPTGDNMFKYLFVHEINRQFFQYLLNMGNIPDLMVMGGGQKIKNIDYYYNMIDNGEKLENVIRKLKKNYKV